MRMRKDRVSQERLTDVVVRDVDPAHKAAVVEDVGVATGLSQKECARIVDKHEVIECDDYIEAKVLKEDLEADGATVELRESVEGPDEDAEDMPSSRFTSREEEVADQTALGVLDAKLQRVAQQNIANSETVRVALKGNSGQALLALDDRLVVLKAGWLVGATFGGKATSFPYEQISAIELRTGPINAVLQIQSSAFQAATVGSYWTKDKDHDPWKLPNCITAPSSTAKKWRPHLDAIRARIARGVWPGHPVQASPATPAPAVHQAPDLAGQLAQLAELRRSGALTMEEFEQAKKRLLSQA